MTDELRMMLAGLLLRLDEVERVAGREWAASGDAHVAVYLSHVALQCLAARYAAESAMERLPAAAPTVVQ
jgi:hypothetical protein